MAFFSASLVSIMNENFTFQPEVLANKSRDSSPQDCQFPTFPILMNPFEEREDACTQTDGHKKPMPVEQICYPKFPYPEELETLQKLPFSLGQTQILGSPPLRRKTNQHLRNKTPNTVKILMEKHRENERLRHHSLNEHLRLICKKVPGSAEDGKETKVVMMQRIISYMAYLENTVRFMCSELGTQADPNLLLLTSSVQDIEQAGTWNREFVTFSSDDSDSEVSVPSLSRRLKLSSPTIDSTTDSLTGSSDLRVSGYYESGLNDDSQDSAVPSSNYSVEVNDSVDGPFPDFVLPSEEIVIGEPGNLDTFLGDTQYDNAMFELPSSTFEVMDVPEVKWLGSPDLSPNMSQVKQDVGIKCDHSLMQDQPNDLMNTLTTVSPDQILPLATIKQELKEQMEQVSEQVVPEFTPHAVSEVNVPVQIDVQSSSRVKKRKQMSPKRTALVNVTNWMEILGEVAHQGAGVPGWVVYDRNEAALAQGSTPFIVGNFEEVVSSESVSSSKTNPRDEPITKSELVQASNSIIREASVTSSKLDLRKSSWMNGFMMYSRLHRKRFIRENPGIHTSVISKMMGQAWRAMTSEQQGPYREQARICSQELQRQLDEARHT
ncbi:uncharacterized protein LOC101857319 isoform X2 [Aplysia californica]|uniref:Sex-determining region Y protein n=1 Tax=Aplysia californica TaxID=6500 RepID=A0ABM0ZW87_APLCA|nr:uncharacterized protein LOC101857319 isoform X2 [Aplysia californica]